MDPAIIKLVKKKGPMFQCTVDECTEHGDRLSMERHVLLRHVEKNKIPYSCSVCDFVSTKEKEVLKHHTWYLPHKSQKHEKFEVIRGVEPVSINLKKWETVASNTYWIQRLHDKKPSKTVGSGENLQEQEEPIEDIATRY